MKNIILVIISYINNVFLKISFRNTLLVEKSRFNFVKISEALKDKNKIKIYFSSLEKSNLYVKGNNNEIDINGALIANSKISITG